MSGRKKIQKGTSDFKYIVGNNGYFVDKTVIDWWEMEHRVARLLLEETAQHLINNRLEAFEKGFKQIMGQLPIVFAGKEPFVFPAQ